MQVGISGKNNIDTTDAQTQHKLGTRKLLRRRPHVKGVLTVISLYSFFPLLVYRKEGVK